MIVNRWLIVVLAIAGIVCAPVTILGELGWGLLTGAISGVWRAAKKLVSTYKDLIDHFRREWNA